MNAAYAFRVVGSAANRREVVGYKKAYELYAAADLLIQPELPACLSAFSYPVDFKKHVEKTNSTAEYTGLVGVPALNFDIDREDIGEALIHARRLGVYLADRYDRAPDIFFSGAKGFHLSVATGGAVEPAQDSHEVARTLALRCAGEVGVDIDGGVYDKVRLWRAPNSWHPRTGLHKIRIDLDEFEVITLAEIRRRAARPVPYEFCASAPVCPVLVNDWRDAQAETIRIRESRPRRSPGDPDRTELNFLTWLLISDPVGIKPGERHKTLFSAAADLAEFQTVESLIIALLSHAGRFTGLPPREVKRQILCGIKHVRGANGGGA
jgi:hypothetical protein